MGLVITLLRIAAFAAAAFGVFFGLAYAIRSRTQAKLGAEIRAEFAALKAGLEAGVYTHAEADSLTQAIHQKCAEAGIETPAALSGNTHDALAAPKSQP